MFIYKNCGIINNQGGKYMELYKYENFDTKTKLFLNKAMDIYSTIKNVSITKKFKYAQLQK